MDILTFSSQSAASQAATKHLAQLLTNYQEQPILLMLSGGSALDLLHSTPEHKWRKVTLCVVDERWSTDPCVNNCTQLLATPLASHALAHGSTLIDSRVRERESLQKFAERFSNALHEWYAKYPNGITIATLGMGSDKHTAGIFPYPEKPHFFNSTFNSPKQWIAGYDVKNKNPYRYRVTVTLPFLRERINHAIIYVCGENKREALHTSLMPGDTAEAPARVIQDLRDAKIFTDITTQDSPRQAKHHD